MRPTPFAKAAAALLLPLSVAHQQAQALLGLRATPAPAPAYREPLLRLHESLVSIESLSGHEAAVGHFLADYLAGRGYTAELQPVAPAVPGGPARFNVLAWPGARRAPAPRVVVSSHMDVVPPHIPYSIADRGATVSARTRIAGRGSVDAKGAVAAMVTAVDELLRARAVIPDHLMLLFVVGEETDGKGMRTFSDARARMRPPPLPLSAVVFGEPTDNRLACGHKGGLFCEITARGLPGHSGYPWLGKSANELMVRALARVLDADLGSSVLFGNTTFNVGIFDGGIAANVIPEHALVRMAARVAIGPEETGHLEVRRKIQRILDSVDGTAFTFECSHGYGSVECDCRIPGASFPSPSITPSYLADCAELTVAPSSHLGFDNVTVNYGTDIPNLEGNHTRYLYGPGSILVAHGAQEGLTVGDLETAVEGYKKIILHALHEAE